MAINLFRHIFRSLTPYYDYSYFIGTLSCKFGIKMSFRRRMYLPFVPLTSKPSYVSTYLQKPLLIYTLGFFAPRSLDRKTILAKCLRKKCLKVISTLIVPSHCRNTAFNCSKVTSICGILHTQVAFLAVVVLVCMNCQIIPTDSKEDTRLYIFFNLETGGFSSWVS